MSYPSDEELYGRFLKTGDPDGIEQLLERHREGLSLFIYGIVGNMEDAEDLMLDTFAVVVSRRSAFRGMSSFKTWLFGIGRNQALMFIRKNRIRTVPLYEETTVPDTPVSDLISADTPDLVMLREERYQQLYLALRQINPDYRQVLYLLYFEEMPHDRIAKVMKKNRHQIYKLANRGRDALRKQLEKMGFDSTQC